MRFSVLLPTKNGGKFLEGCIRSIMGQSYDDFELIVSDNANTDETIEVLDNWRGHPKIKVVRLEKPVSVTENWNNALREAHGDYVLMMGDDDYLLPGYFNRMSAVIDQYSQPDCILYNGYSFVAPNSVGDASHSFYSETHFRYNADLLEEKVLPVDLRYAIVKDMFCFKVRIPLNMQTTLVKRLTGMKIPGGMFQPPFPDHYALNSLLLLTDKWVLIPENLVVVGVSPKSFGHYVYNNKQENGLAYLGIKSDFNNKLPGNELLNGMHLWLDKLKIAFPTELGDVKIDREGYVRRQVYAWYMQLRHHAISLGEFISNFSLLGGRDWIGLLATFVDKECWERLKRQVNQQNKSELEQLWFGLHPLESVNTITDFAIWISSRKKR